MVPDEVQSDGNWKSRGWKSRLRPEQRTWWIGANYFANPPFSLDWARNSEQAPNTWFRRPPRDPKFLNSLYSPCTDLRGHCVYFNDCPSGKMLSTYGKIFLDIENDGIGLLNRQEQANLYVYMVKTIKENVLPGTEIGSIAPTPHNDFGYSRAGAYTAAPEWLWTLPARHTGDSRKRGMPDEIIGKSFGDVADFMMPGVYFLSSDFDYNLPRTGDADRHWLAMTLHEQEVNAYLSPKKRIAWQWVFNTQSGNAPNSHKSDHPAPPAVAEGLAIFYWFTGAYGALFWDDAIDLTPDPPVPSDPVQRGIGSDRNYACYEHYVHGLWRLFKHHGDFFNGKEIYMNDQTECSYDGGKTWLKYNASQLKTGNAPFVRYIVNGDQILVAATKPYARPDQTHRVMVRYVRDGYQFYSQINLKGDEIFLGRATMPKAASSNRRAAPRKVTEKG